MPTPPFVAADLFPPNLDIDKANIVALAVAFLARAGTLPGTYVGYRDGELVTVRLAENGIVPASDGDTPIDAGGRALGHFRPDVVECSGTVLLTSELHMGRLLYCPTTAATLLQIELTSDPATGVQHGFACTLYRDLAAGPVQVSTSSLANRNRDGHTAVAADGFATLFVDGIRTRLIFKGDTAA